MAAKSRNPLERERDLRETAALYLRGLTQVEIAQKLNVSRQQIGYDLKVLQHRWQESALADFDAKKAAELAKIDELERTYWDAWQRSCQTREVTTQESIRGGEGQADEDRRKAGVRKEQRDGNPEYLKRVEWCISKRCELLRLNPPQRLEHGGSAELPPIQTEMQVELTRAQRFVRLAALLADGGIVPPDGSDRSGSSEAPRT